MTGRDGMRTMRWFTMVAILASALAVHGQSSAGKGTETPTQSAAAQPSTETGQDDRVFQLTFTARELDENGKVVNTRKFVTTATAGPSKNGGGGNIRTGAKIPVATSGSGNFTYVDVGANFDVSRVRVVKGNRLAMQVTADISSVDSTVRVESNPTIRQNRWMGEVEVPIGGRRIFFSSDDLASRRSMQIELAVTPDAER
jgi:hypothetical protein